MIPHISRRAQVPGPDSVRAYLPDNLDFDPVLRHDWQDYGRFVVGGLYLRRHLEKQREADDYRPLSSAALKEVLPKRDYRRILDALQDHDIIEPLLNDDGQESYQAGRTCKSYRLTASFRDARFRSVQLTHQALVRKVLARRTRDAGRVTAAVHCHLRGMFDRLEVTADYPKVSLPLTCIADREFIFTVCRQGRVHTNLTNLSRELRPFIRHARKPLWAVDVANSQPLLMALTLRADGATDPGLSAYTQWLATPHTPPPPKHHHPIPPSLPYVGTWSDSDRFLEVCLEGRLYERLMARTGYDRAEVKKRFFAVAYGKPEQAATTIVGRAFAAEFPDAWAAVHELNGRDNAALARRMQAVESYICVWRTCARLMAEFPDAPLYTLHDGLLSDQEHIDQFADVLRAEFRAVFGVTPRVTTGPFS